MDRSFKAVCTLLLVFSQAGCSESPGGEDLVAGTAASDIVVDSIHPIEEEIRRFALEAGPATVALGEGAADSFDNLAADYVAALSTRDTASLADLVVTPAEFIHLYFPHTVYVSPPYEMDPAFIWFQMNNLGSRGVTRALNRYAGATVRYRGHSCPDGARQEGANYIWERCVVRLLVDGEETEAQLFGPVLEREGRFKFITYGNPL